MEARSVPDGIISLLEEHRLTASDAVPIAEASGRHGWWHSDLKDRVDLRNTRAASAETVAAVLRTELDRQPETRGMRFDLLVEKGSACGHVNVGGWSGRISTGTYASLQATALSIARTARARVERRERQAAIARHPCCVCLVAIGGRCMTCKAQDQGGAPAETILSSVIKSHQRALQHDTEQRPINPNHVSVDGQARPGDPRVLHLSSDPPSGYEFRLDRNGNMLTCDSAGRFVCYFAEPHRHNADARWWPPEREAARQYAARMLGQVAPPIHPETAGPDDPRVQRPMDPEAFIGRGRGFGRMQAMEPPGADPQTAEGYDLDQHATWVLGTLNARRMGETDAELRERIAAKLRGDAIVGTEPWGTWPTGPGASESAAVGGGGGGGGLMIRNRFEDSREGLPVPPFPGSVAAIRAAVLAVLGVESCEAEQTSPSHVVLRVQGGDGLDIRRAADDARSMGCSVEIRHSTPGQSRRVDDPGPEGLRALENAAESLGVQMRTALPEGWSWSPDYACCADGPGRRWALVEDHADDPSRGAIGTPHGQAAPPDVLAALVTEARRLGIPVKWEPQEGDVVVTISSGCVGRIGFTDGIVADGFVSVIVDGQRWSWHIDHLRPATTDEAARA